MSSQFYYSKQQAPRKPRISEQTIAGTLFTGSTSFNETINLTLKVFRSRFTEFLIPQIIAYTPIVIGMPFILANFSSIMSGPFFESNSKSLPEFDLYFAFFGWMALILLVFSFLYPFSTIVCSRLASDELHCGHSTWRDELKDKFWTRYWVLVSSLAMVNISVMLLVGIVLIILTLIFSSLATVSGSGGAIAAAVIFSVILFFVVLVLIIAVPFMFYLIEPICSNEDVEISNLASLLIYGPIDQIKRTFQLVKANFLKFLGITVIVLILVNFIQSIFMAPLSIGTTLYKLYYVAKTGVLDNPNSGMPDMQITWLDILRQSAATIVTILFAPVYVILKTVLYYQTRIDRENYDLDLMLVNLPENQNKKILETQISKETDSPWTTG